MDAQDEALQETSPQSSPFTDLPVSHWAYCHGDRVVEP